MIGSAFKLDAVRQHASHGFRQRRAVGIENSEVIEARAALGRARGAATGPCVQADVVVITASGQEDGVRAVAGRNLKAHRITVECERTLEITHREVDMADASTRIDAH